VNNLFNSTDSCLRGKNSFQGRMNKIQIGGNTMDSISMSVSDCAKRKIQVQWGNEEHGEGGVKTVKRLYLGEKN